VRLWEIGVSPECERGILVRNFEEGVK